MQPNSPTPATPITPPIAPAPPAAPQPPIEPSSSSTIQSPAGADVQIDDVNKSLWTYVKQKKLTQLLLFVPLLFLWEFGAIKLLIYVSNQTSNYSNNSSDLKGPLFLIILPVLLFYAWIGKLRQQFEDAFLQEFAKENNYTFDKHGAVNETYGSIFIQNGQQFISDVITGNYKGYDMRLFLYRLNVQEGRSSVNYDNTVLELDLKGKLPHLFMENSKGTLNRLDIAAVMTDKHTIQLEGDFNKYFTLHGSIANEIPAREVFSPDVMAIMEDNSKHYSVEFVGDRIYIYSKGFISNNDDLRNVFNLAKKLVEKIAPMAARFTQDSSIQASATNIVTLQKMQKRTKFVTKLVYGFVIFMIILTILAFIASSAGNSASN